MFTINNTKLVYAIVMACHSIALSPSGKLLQLLNEICCYGNRAGQSFSSCDLRIENDVVYVCLGNQEAICRHRSNHLRGRWTDGQLGAYGEPLSFEEIRCADLIVLDAVFLVSLHDFVFRYGGS